MAKPVKIFKKALGTFFSHLQALTNSKVSETSAVLGLSANFLNIVTRKNKKKTNFYPERDFPNVKILLSTKNNIEPIRRKVNKCII